MTYSKTTWADRVVQYPYRYSKSGETTTEVTLQASPGTVTAAGTAVNATNLNKLENGLFDESVANDNQFAILAMGGF
jgi:hypothetical protein